MIFLKKEKTMDSKNGIVKVVAAAAVSSVLLVGCSSMNDGYLGAGGYKVTKTGGISSRSPAAMPETIPATGNNVFVYDPKVLTWAAYDAQGRLIRKGIGSGGAAYCSDIKKPCRTPAGTFKVYREGGPNCKSKIFPLGRGGAPMPNCAFFNGGYAVHGSYDIPDYNASHGCIRVVPADAAWLDDNVMHPGATVIVRSY
jgi:lipoprotein-anchoring transpeptidase ErfK/SrfK